MNGQWRPRGLASRFFLAQVIVVAASILAAVLIASLVGPPLFHEHLMRAGAAHDPTQLMHVERAYRDTNLWILGVALATALACAAGVTWLFTRRIQRPIDALTRAARGMARGRYDVRVPAMGAGTEVDALAASFNTMAERLQRTEDTRRRMLSDLAHEMRTPISVLTVYLEALQDGVTTWNESTSDLMTEQLARLTRLVEDINDVSRAEEGRMVLDHTMASAGELVRAAAEANREGYAGKGVELRVEDAVDTRVPVDRQRMGQVLDNLLTNASRHTPPAGSVVLRAVASGPDQVRLDVADTGEGISDEHLSHLFERFYRGDTARDRDHGGSGIGLTISKALVEAHGGTLIATSPGPGRRMTPCFIPHGGIYRWCGTSSPPPLPHPMSFQETTMTSSPRTPLPMASTGCACCAPAAPGATTAIEVPAPEASSASRTYPVEGMTCGSCAGRVTEAITALEDVAEVRVELVPGGTSAVVVTGSADPDTVQTAIERSGYTLARS